MIWLLLLASGAIININIIDGTVQATVVHVLLTVPPYKSVQKMSFFLRPWTLQVSYSNWHSVKSDHDKNTKFSAQMYNICVHM